MKFWHLTEKPSGVFLGWVGELKEWIIIPTVGNKAAEKTIHHALDFFMILNIFFISVILFV